MKDRTWLTQLIIQPIMIVLSILAALAVNNWQEARAKARRVANTRAAFVNEITANDAMLRADDHWPHHKRLRDEYAKIATEGAPDSHAFFKTGLHPTPLRDSTWRMVSGSTTLTELPSGFVLALTDIYRLQNSIEKSNEGFLNSLAAPRSDRESPAYQKDVANSIRMYLNDLVQAEESLLRHYGHVLERLKDDRAPWDDELITARPVQPSPTP